jgi:hypothetical protein
MSCVELTHSLTSTMAKSTRKRRLQTYHAEDIGSLEHKSVLLSNTSKHLRRVVTNIPIPASDTEKINGDDGPGEMTVDESMDLHADANAGATSYADLEHPAGLRIQTRAKHYQNSVSWPICFLLLL